MTKLKPCPFCGGEAQEARGSIINNYIFCVDCGTDKRVEGTSTGFYLTPELAVEAWNRRADEKEADQ